MGNSGGGKRGAGDGRRPIILVRGGGDLATGVAVRLWRSGFGVLVTELERPLAVRRLVALAEAVYAGEVEIEEARGVRVETPSQALHAIEAGAIPVLVDPQASVSTHLRFEAWVDGRMRKAPPETIDAQKGIVIGLGPGFTAPVDCTAVVETMRGHTLGRVIRDGSAAVDTRVPEAVAGVQSDRVLRAPQDGIVVGKARLGELLHVGDAVAEVGGAILQAPFDGALRGLLHDGLIVNRGAKIGDLDPRSDPTYCRLISDKSLAVGGGVLEALLSEPRIRRALAA